ncbi:hypothetical protein KHS38_04220 [Mucilaginibacter sp. Bleaf8]|nr:hypothetical protein [Mucilaginibacter sp. Bleaf8]MBS7563603.1 hypothetical protein [Mucilaginibacter sp. Bleaf8]
MAHQDITQITFTTKFKDVLGLLALLALGFFIIFLMLPYLEAFMLSRT